MEAENNLHNLDLINNSISFFKEAVSYAQRGKEDIAQWKFATINIVQAMELALKEALNRIHPAFVYEDIDLENPEKTVTIQRALSRLKLPHIGNFSISENESRKFLAAIKMRNRFTHHHCNYSSEEMEVKFSGVFAFMLYFYEHHLSVPRDEIISSQQYNEIFSLKNAKEELLEKVKLFLKSNDVGTVWCCVDCFEDTFVTHEQACRLCGYQEEVVICQECEEEFFAHELVDISHLFDYDEDEGLIRLRNDYGHEFDKACKDCARKIKDEIRDEQFAQYCEDMEMDAWYSQQKA